MTFWNHLFMLLASILAPKTTPKWNQKGSQYEIKKSSILLLFTTLAPHWGIPKIIIFGTCLVPFLRYLFEISFSSILDPFGDPLGTLWAPKKHPKKHTKKRHQKRAQHEPVLAREREARLNVQASSQARVNSYIAWACNNAPTAHSPTWHQRYSDQVNGPMRDTSTSCGLRPRLRRCRRPRWAT